MEAPPPPVIAISPVSFGAMAVRVGPRTARIEVQASGRIIGRRPVARGPRRISVRLPVGLGPVRVRAVGRGGSRWSRTVRARVLPPASRRAGRLPGFVDRRLQADVRAATERLPAIGGVYVQHLITGCGAAVNADAQFPGASTLKAAILVDAVRRGRHRRLAGTLDAMIVDSSDRAANVVLRAGGDGSPVVGAGRVTETLRDLGFARSLVRRPYIIEDARERLPIRTEATPALFTNFITTPYELSRLMVAIHRGAIGAGGVGRLGISERIVRSELLARLLDVRDPTKLARGLPAGTPLAHKSGFTEQVKHDAGVVYLRRGPVVVAAMSWSASGVSDAAGSAFIADIARAAARRLSLGGSCRGLPLRG